MLTISSNKVAHAAGVNDLTYFKIENVAINGEWYYKYDASKII